MAHGPCLYVLKLFICQKGFFCNGKKLSPLDVDYQWKEQAKTIARLDDLKKPIEIP